MPDLDYGIPKTKEDLMKSGLILKKGPSVHLPQ